MLVHGFNGFTDDINPSVLAHYWGGNKMNIRQDLEENGYKAYEASISAFEVTMTAQLNFIIISKAVV